VGATQEADEGPDEPLRGAGQTEALPPAPWWDGAHRLAAHPRCSVGGGRVQQGKSGEEAMPLVKIETGRWMTQQTKRSLLDAVHRSLVTAFGIPDHDRNQRIVEYGAGDLESAAGKSDRFTIITIDAFAGRSVEAKRTLYRELASRLAALGIPAMDLAVVVHDVPLESWGIQGGQAACDVDVGFEIEV
jgi:phenylpyruvate tautomerase PptA (4-oxalocrotonate tautomerase family)